MRSGMRAQVEMISIMILISITLIAGYLIYRAYTMQLQQQQAGVALATKLSKSRIAEKLVLVTGFINVSNKKVILVFYNFGDEDTYITKIVIPGMKAGGELKLFVFKGEYRVPRRDIRTLRFTISDPNVGYPPGISVRITVWTLTGRVYSYNIRTVG